MAMARSVPSPNFVTGFDVEKRSFTWTIENFHVVRKKEETIDSQSIDFTAGETTGTPSQWKVFLTQEEKVEEGDVEVNEGERWIGIYLELKGPNPTDDIFKGAYSEIDFTIKRANGTKTIKEIGLRPIHIATEFDESPSWGSGEFIDAEDGNDCPEQRLVIHITFKLYTPSQPKSITGRSLEAIMEEFQVKFSDQLRKDLSGLLGNPIPGTDIKIISSDKKEFSMQRRILAVRSDVFAAMLDTDMIEANAGVLELPDISSKALKVFLNFLNSGDLLPEWRDNDVILELTNAAAKYQLKDLLQFMDETMGKVCQLENVVALATLARLLSLKVAEEGLLMFLRREGVPVGSLDDFLRMWNEKFVGDEESDEPQAKKQKTN